MSKLKSILFDWYLALTEWFWYKVYVLFWGILMKINDIHTNPNNPRLIKDDRFAKLVKSIQEFPKMMELRPIIIDSDNMILGGNQRYKALKELKYKEVPDEWVKRANELTDDEKQRFIISDNVPFGEHDWDMLKEWDQELLQDWGLDIPEFLNEPENLIGEEKDKKPTINITFVDVEQLQQAEIDIQGIIDRKYKGAFFNVSCGEI